MPKQDINFMHKLILSLLITAITVIFSSCRSGMSEVIDFNDPYLTFIKDETHDIVQQKIRKYETRKEIIPVLPTTHLTYEGENENIDKIVYEILNNGGHYDFYDAIIFFNIKKVTQYDLLDYMEIKGHKKITSTNFVTRYQDNNRNIYIDMHIPNPEKGQYDLKFVYLPIRN
jgi:hypothetical protein